MDSLLTVILYSNATKDIVQTKLDESSQVVYNSDARDNIFIPFNIEERDIEQFIVLCNKFMKYLKKKWEISNLARNHPMHNIIFNNQSFESVPFKDLPSANSLLSQNSRRRARMIYSVSCDLSLQLLTNINKKIKNYNGGNYVTILITIQLINYLFMNINNYIDISILIPENKDVAYKASIINDSFAIIFSVHIKKGNFVEGHATCVFSCGNSNYYYDDNLSDFIEFDWKTELKRMINNFKRSEWTLRHFKNGKDYIYYDDIIITSVFVLTIKEKKKYV